MKFAAIADWAQAGMFEVEFMCRELGVSRSGYYAWRGRAPSDRDGYDATLTGLIRQIHAGCWATPACAGSTPSWPRSGTGRHQKRVWRLMKAAGLEGRHPKPFKRTTIPANTAVAAPDLIRRDFTAETANTRWCGGISYVKTWDGWAYLATVIDLPDRAVPWSAETSPSVCVTTALDMAIFRRRPAAAVIFYSDTRRAVHVERIHRLL